MPLDLRILEITGNPPDAWASSDFSVSATGTSGQLRLSITDVPAGATDLQYDIDGSNSWVSLATASPGTFYINGLTNGVSYTIRPRASNNDGTTTITGEAATPAVSSESAAVVVTKRSASQVAPEAFMFEIALNGFDSVAPTGGVVKDDRWHDVYYKWDFDTLNAGGTYTYTAPTQVVELGAHSSSRYGYGPIGSVTYRAAGTYRVTCLCTEPSSGKSATATLDVTVGNPNTLFSANNQTIVLDSTGTGLAAYPNATIVTTIPSMISTMHTHNDGVARRVFVRRGQTFATGSSALNLGKNGNVGTVHILAADEAGDDPVFTTNTTLNWYDNFKSAGSPKDFVMQDVKMQGPWDSTTETGSKINALAVNREPPQMYLIDKCEMDGFEHCFYGNSWPDTAVTSYFFNDTTWTNWRFYGSIDGSSNNYVMTGCSIRQAALANAGGPKSTGANNAHSGLRVAKVPTLLVHSCDFYSRNDWFAQNGVWGQQPNLRYDTDGIGGGFVSVQASIFEGGANNIVFGTETGSIANKACNFVLEKNYLLATHATRYSFATGKGGVTFRNNIAVIPDTPRYSGYSYTAAIKAAWDGLNTTNRDTPQGFYSNTIINLSDQNVSATETSGFTTMAEDNNLFYQPNSGSPNTADGPLDTTQAFTPREPGYKENVSYGTGRDTLQTAYATPGSSVWDALTLTGSAAIGDAATGSVAYDDFFGTVRATVLSGLTRSVASRGAHEPNLES